MDLDHLAQWTGRSEEASDIVTPRLLASFRATFGDRLAPAGPDEAPLALHWCLAPPIVPLDATGPDGHAAKGGFLPPVPLPRRMWAGGHVEWLAPLRSGDEVVRHSRIGAIETKEGRSGPLCFVAVHHEFSTGRGMAIRERHDIVYRESPRPGSPGQSAPAPAPSPAFDLEWRIETDPVLLFRYSALSFNSHRIHYDHPYVTGVEGYAGLVVHGPIQATLLANIIAAAAGTGRIAMDYRGLAPLMAGTPLSIRAARLADGSVSAWTQSAAGQVHMRASGLPLP